MTASRDTESYDGVLFSGHYKIVGAPLYQSESVQVFPAIDQRDGTEVVIKILDAGVSKVRRSAFERAAALLCGLAHPALARGLAHGEHGGSPHMILERLSGAPLAEILFEYGELTVEWASALMMTALEGLAVLHGQGIVHRDLTPDHFFLADPGTDGERLVITGLGAETVVGVGGVWRVPESESAAVVGAAAYMAPEYLRDRVVSPAVDVYQVALTLGAMVTGEPLVRATGLMESAQIHLMGGIAMPYSLSSSVMGPVVQKALSRDPERRYADAEGLLDALRRASRMSKVGIWVFYEPIREIAAGFPARMQEVRDRRTGERGFAVRVEGVAEGSEAARALGGVCEIFGALDHAHLARLLFRDTQVDCVDVVLQGAPGRLLSAELSQSGPMAVARAIRLMGGLLGALAQAHHQGVVHGGLTPEAVWLARPGLIEERAILLGFWEPLWSALGWSEESMDAWPRSSLALAACVQTDVYQAALMFLELVSGVEAGGWREDGGHLDLPEAIAGGPLALAVLGALCRAPEDRHRDAGVFRTALEKSTIY